MRSTLALMESSSMRVGRMDRRQSTCRSPRRSRARTQREGALPIHDNRCGVLPEVPEGAAAQSAFPAVDSKRAARAISRLDDTAPCPWRRMLSRAAKRFPW